MTVRIARLSTCCLAPRGQEQAAVLVDEVARVALPRALKARLGPSLDREAQVCRLKSLEVKVRIDADALRRGALPDAWANALASALHEALARPGGASTPLRRYATRAVYLASMIGAILAGRVEPNWEFPELAAAGRQPPGVLILDILLAARALLPDVLEALSQNRQLEPALALQDEVALERLLRASSNGDSPRTATLEQVIAIAAVLAARGLPPKSGESASRRQAIALWLEVKSAIAVREIWHALRLLMRLVREPALMHSREPAGALSDLPEWCENVRLELAQDAPAQTLAVLERLRAVTPGAAPALTATARERWLASDCAGILLLCDTVRRLGWPRQLRAQGETPRVLQALLAGAGMRLLRPKWMASDAVEPGVGLFAGCTEDVDLDGLARIFEGSPPRLMELDAPDWSGTLEQAANALATAFAARIRGFRSAGRDAVVRQFLRIAGRVLVTDDELRVVLEPRPWSVALHISGADDPIDALTWLGGRRVTFVLEGL